MKRLIRSTLLASACAAVCALTAMPPTASAASPANSQTLAFGVDPTFPPFESKTPDGSFVGFDIDLGNAICAQLNVHCKWVEQGFDGMIPALKARKFDAILSAMTATPARRAQIDFTDKLYGGSARLIAPAGSKLQPSVDSLRGHRIGVQQGAVQESYARAEWAPNGVTIVSYQSPDQIYEDLSTGRLDASFQASVQADLGFLRTPRGKSFAFAGAEVKDPRATGDGIAIGARKGDEQLIAKINQAIDAIRKSGTYDKLAHRYFSFDIYGD
ncbi:ABC transporter substrate-binding protein [Paraburkholderia sp. UYCP14C]|uniref:ABC transporter substrate-binding protein n=1 Tax=Paraburkholderia sp. UYCP14C TaxID=2511130 RepID=UPI0026A26F18